MLSGVPHETSVVSDNDRHFILPEKSRSAADEPVKNRAGARLDQSMDSKGDAARPRTNRKKPKIQYDIVEDTVIESKMYHAYVYEHVGTFWALSVLLYLFDVAVLQSIINLVIALTLLSLIYYSITLRGGIGLSK